MDLTVKDYEQIIQSRKAKLLNFSLKPSSGNLRGYVAQSFELVLNIEADNLVEELVYFVKSLKDADGLCECFKDHGLYEKELFVYKFFEKVAKVLPNVATDVIPKLIHHTDGETLVMENLIKAGYKDLKARILDKQHLLSVLEAVAKFHSVTIAYEELKSKELGRKYQLDEEHGDIFPTYFTKDPSKSGFNFVKSTKLGAFTAIELVYAEKAEEFKNKLEDYVPKFLDLMNAKNNFRKVLNHGDVWEFNCLFKYENEKPIDCKLIDFQIQTYAPPALDVAMAIYSTITPKMYQNYIHEFYQYYYQKLSEELQRIGLDIDLILPIEEFELTCKLYMPCAIYINLCYRQFSLTDEEYLIKIRSDKSKWLDVILGESRAEFVRHSYQNFPKYKQGIETFLEDTRMFLISKYITLEDCCKIIKNNFGSNLYQVTDFDMTKLIKSGFMGEQYQLNIKVKTLINDKILTYFVKTEPATEFYKRVCVQTKVDLKEMNFYGKILKDITNYNIATMQEVVPKCYLNTLTVTVLEDLQRKGYTTFSAREYMQPELIKTALTALAKFHASCIVYEEKIKRKSGVKKINLDRIYSEELIENFYSSHEICEAFINSFKKGLIESIRIFSTHTTNITTEEFTKIAVDIVNQYRDLIKPSNKYRNTICHSDIWHGNVMFNLHDKPKAKLVDFQFYRYCPPAHDVMQFIYFTTNKETRKKYMQEFLQDYHKEFKSIIKEYDFDILSILPYKDFLASCENEKLFAITQACTHFQNILISTETMQDFFEDEEFNLKANVDRSEMVRMNCAKDPVYAERLKASIVELREMCEKIASSKDSIKLLGIHL